MFERADINILKLIIFYNDQMITCFNYVVLQNEFLKKEIEKCKLEIKNF